MITLVSSLLGLGPTLMHRTIFICYRRPHISGIINSFIATIEESKRIWNTPNVLNLLKVALISEQGKSLCNNSLINRILVLPEAIASQAEQPEGRVVLEKDEVNLCNSVGLQQQIWGLAVLDGYWRLGEISARTVDDVWGRTTTALGAFRDCGGWRL